MTAPAAKSGLEEHVVVVTGAGIGMGRAHAMLLASLGATVVVNDVGRDTNGNLTAAIVADAINAIGGSAWADTSTISDPDAAQGLIAATLQQFGRIDAVVSNAGTSHWSRFQETPQELLQEQLAVHLVGPFALLQAAYRRMVGQGSGRLVIVSSGTGLFGRAYGSAYAAAKAALVGLTKVIALESDGTGVCCNAVLPVARTTITTTAPRIGDVARPRRDGPVPPGHEPEHVSPLIAYLSSPRCQTSGAIYAAVAGHYSRVVFGVGPGWGPAHDAPPSIDEVDRAWSMIDRTDALSVPDTMWALVDAADAQREASRQTAHTRPLGIG